MRNSFSILFLLFLFFLPHHFSHAFAFIFAGDANGLDVVTHPIGYTGTGGIVSVSVGIDPSSVNAASMVIPVQNVICTFNDLVATTGNVLLGGANDVGASEVDFESVLLHEMGHSLGLAHANAATESGLTGVDQNYTKATDGTDNVFNLDDGVDNVIGSEDDVRGDDVLLHYFRISNNDPFTIDATVDGTTYSRDVADLPVGDNFATNADRSVGAAIGVVSTECAMQQGTFSDEAQRSLGHDDVAGLRYAMAGLDEVAGTADDYTLVLTYAGLTATADIVIDFDNAQTGFAVSQSGGTFIGADHIAVTTNSIYFNDGFSWYFNPVVLPVEWVHFSAETEGQNVRLHWATAREMAVQSFEMERSQDQQNWETRGLVSPDGSEFGETTYQFMDYGAAQQGNRWYYRIRQVDIDGSSTYSETREVLFSREKAELLSFGPIPVQAHTSLSLFLVQTERLSLTIRDLAGRELRHWQEVRTAGTHRVQLGEEILQLSSGAYLLDVQSASLKEVYKFVR